RGHGSPGQRVVLAARGAAGERRARVDVEQRVCAGRRLGEPDAAAELELARLQRGGDDQLQAADQGQRRAADGSVLQDPDVHAVDDNAVMLWGAPRRAPFAYAVAPTASRCVVSTAGEVAGSHSASWPNGTRTASPWPVRAISVSSARSRSGEPL